MPQAVGSEPDGTGGVEGFRQRDHLADKVVSGRGVRGKFVAYAPGPDGRMIGVGADHLSELLPREGSDAWVRQLGC